MTLPSQRPTTADGPIYESRASACPDCGGSSTETRISAAHKLNGVWLAHRCSACLNKSDEARDAEARATKTQLMLAALDVPPLYRASTLVSFTLVGDREHIAKQGRVLQLARRYLAEWPDVPMIAVFIGCPGSGKGHLVWSIARELVAANGVSARVCVLSDVIRDLREAWGSRDDGGLSEAQRLAKYRAPELLVIDEVSRHAFYGQPQQHLYDLIAWREIRLKPTIITTNETGGDLAEFLGPALSSRALGWGAPWDFGDVDYRLTRGMRKVG